MCIDDNFNRPVIRYTDENAFHNFIEAILKEYNYCIKIMKEHFNKNVIMSVVDKQRFQSNNKCWICNKLFADEDKKVRDRDHITGKYRGVAHSGCNINLKLTKKVSVIFHNLRGYDSHLIMQEIGKLDVKVNVISNWLEKYMAFIINNNLFFIDRMQFMESSLDALVKNFRDNDFKHLSQEFNGQQLNLVKRKGVYPYEYMNSIEKCSEDKV